MKSLLKPLFAAAIAAAALQNASAVTSVLQATDNGWYRSNGYHDASNTNTLTGWFGPTWQSYQNSFYNFDTSSLVGANIVSAFITFYGNNGVYFSNESTETLQIWDVSGSTPGLVDSAEGDIAGIAIYNDLMSGTLYGQTTLATPSSFVSMPQFSVSLSPASFLDIASDSVFSLGAHLATADDDNDFESFWAASDLEIAAYLTVETTSRSPVPDASSTLALLSATLLCLAALRRRKA